MVGEVVEFIVELVEVIERVVEVVEISEVVVVVGGIGGLIMYRILVNVLIMSGKVSIVSCKYSGEFIIIGRLALIH